MEEKWIFHRDRGCGASNIYHPVLNGAFKNHERAKKDSAFVMLTA